MSLTRFAGAASTDPSSAARHSVVIAAVPTRDSLMVSSSRRFPRSGRANRVAASAPVWTTRTFLRVATTQDNGAPDALTRGRIVTLADAAVNAPRREASWLHR